MGFMEFREALSLTRSAMFLTAGGILFFQPFGNFGLESMLSTLPRFDPVSFQWYPVNSRK